MRERERKVNGVCVCCLKEDDKANDCERVGMLNESKNKSTY
jgi:hypothetical protein